MRCEGGGLPGAQALHHSTTAIGNYLRKMKSRLGKPEAITATAHKLARIVYHMLTTKERYNESVFAKQRQKDEKRIVQRLKTNALSMGYTLTPIQTAPTTVAGVH